MERSVLAPHSRRTPAQHPRRAPRWSGRRRRKGSAEPAGARRSRWARLQRGTARRVEGGVRAEQGAGTGARCRAGRGRPEEPPLGRTLLRESVNGARPARGGGGGGGRERTEMGPAARGRSAPSRPSTARFAVPAARELEAGPALGVHPGWRKAFPSGRGLEPGALAVAPACLSLSIANVISHADFALALSVSCAVLPVRTCVPRHKVVFQR